MLNETDRPIDYAALKSRHRQERDGRPPALSLRVHRALSWLGRAEQSADDKDVQFILLWVAFNAAYAHDLGVESSRSERERLHAFLGQLCRVDEKRFEALLWHEFSGSVRVLLENRYVFRTFRLLRCRSVPLDRSTKTVLTQLSTAPSSAAARSGTVPKTNRAATFTTRFCLRVLWTVA